MKKYIYLTLAFLGFVALLVFYKFNINYFENWGKENLNNPEANEKLVYETDVDSKDDCTSFEKYDEERKVCYFECQDENECKVIEDKIDKEVSSWTSPEANKEPVFQKNQENKKTDTKNVTENSNAKYSVSSGEKIELVSGKEGLYDRKIWDMISRIAPDALSNKYIETFEIYSKKGDDTLAFVDDEDGSGKWRVAVNLPTFMEGDSREKNMTLVHELGHIVTLNAEQVRTDIDESSCTNYFTGEGCSTSSSYINNFVKSFWSTSDVDKTDKESADIYPGNEDRFVTAYAATNPGEDMAESFAYFVFSSNGDGGNVAKSKVSFFDKYKELVDMKSEMMQGVKANIARESEFAN